MMRPGCAVTTAALLGAAAGCSTSRDVPPTLLLVTPNTAYTDEAIALTIASSGPFHAAYRIDVGSGSGANENAVAAVFLDPAPAASGLVRVPATAVSWNSETEIVATLPAGIAAGSYDVVVADPQGTWTMVSRGFVSLGPDRDPPMVMIDTPLPEALIGAEATPTVAFSADDGVGHLASLTWSVFAMGASTPFASGECTPATGAPTASCMSSFQAPAASAGGTLMIEADAVDWRGNVGTTTVTVAVVPGPTVTSFVSGAGPSSGGTPITVEGTNFIPEATQIFIGETPLVTESPTPTSLSAVTVNHDPGLATVSVRTGGASADAGTFEFVAAPLVRQVTPGRGSPAGGNTISVIGNNFRAGVTTLSFLRPGYDPVSLLCLVFRSASRIDAITPAGTGTVDVVATDPVGGDGGLPQAFVYDDAIAPGVTPDGGCPNAGTSP